MRIVEKKKAVCYISTKPFKVIETAAHKRLLYAKFRSIRESQPAANGAHPAFYVLNSI